MELTDHLLAKTITKELKLHYYVYYPQAAKQEEVPLVIFLHGAGERGSDLSLLTKHGLPKQAAAGEEFPFILVAPQCPSDWTWERSLAELDALLEELLAKYPIDRSRIYLTGLSMGGFGTWHWAARRPKAFAALVPICGGTMPLLGFPEKIAVLKDVPIWVFHGTDDQVVPIWRSRELVEVLEQAGSNVKFTQYEGVGHNSWDLAYNEPELLPWLLAQQNQAFSWEKQD